MLERVKIRFMKVLFVNNFFTSYGGAEIIMSKEAEMLKRNGHEVFFFATDKKPYLVEAYEYAKYFPKNIDYRAASRFEQLVNIFKIFTNSEAANNLDKMLSDVNPDLIHIHNVYYHLTASVLKAIYNRKIPVVMTLHDTRIFCPSGTISRRSESYCKDGLCLDENLLHYLINKCKSGNLSESVVRTAESLFNKAMGFYNNINAFITPSKALYDLAVESGIKKNKINHINNFLSDSFFANEAVYDDKGYFLYVGRLAKEKGVDHLLEAMAKLPDVKLKIAGTGSYEEELKNRAKNLRLTNVEFLGHKEENELVELYKGCIATILPSNCFEVFGLTLLESFTFGKPVIASRIGGIPEIVEDGICGITINPGDVSHLASSIRKLNDDKQLVYKLGFNGKQKAEKLYSEEHHYIKLIELYKSLIIT